MDVTSPALDSDGYLKDLSEWSEDLARELADRADVALTRDHWRVIDMVRAFHAETGVAPAMRPLVKLARLRLGDEFGSSIALMRLFPGNPAKLIAKIGGLPRPTNCDV